jgi:hypothetical protein
MPDDVVRSPAAALELAQYLIDDGRPFHAHEVLELAWKTGPTAERPLWKGLAQLAVGLTHARRGNERGAVTLLRRGGTAIASYTGPVPAGLDPDIVAASAQRLAARIESAGSHPVPEAELRLEIRRS